LRFRKDCIRIILAVVTALPAILLSHRRHHPPAQRTIFGESHPFSYGQGWVMPGSIPCVPRIQRLCPGSELREKRSIRFLVESCGGPDTELQEACEKAVQPSTLLRGERGIFREQIGNGRTRELVHAAASVANISRKTSIS